MAITAVLKMKCVRLQPAVGGSPEVVELEEVFDSDVAKSNLHVMPSNAAVPALLNQLIIDKATAQGSFKKDMLYVVNFTETT